MHKRAFEKIKSGNTNAGVSHSLAKNEAYSGRRIVQDQCGRIAEEPRCALDNERYCSGARGATIHHVRKLGVLLLTVFVLFAPSGFAAVSISGAGSTFIDPAFVKWAAAYAKIEPDVYLDYQAVGSLQGVDRLLAHSTDFAASDAPLHLEQMNQPSSGPCTSPPL